MLNYFIIIRKLFSEIVEEINFFQTLKDSDKKLQESMKWKNL